MASWVLSPSSATKTAPKVDSSVFQSIREIYARELDEAGEPVSAAKPAGRCRFRALDDRGPHRPPVKSTDEAQPMMA